MARTLLLFACLASALAVGVWLTLTHYSQEPRIAFVDIPTKVASAHAQEPIGLCPWRHPYEDMRRFFPGATDSRDETLILSAHRLEVQQRLGRPPTGEENALQIHRIFQGPHPLGVTLTRRVRGESGVIELVLAVGQDGKVIGAEIQRLREPDEVARFLRSEAFLHSLIGKTAESSWHADENIPASARSCAQSIYEGARIALILLDVASQASSEPVHH